MLGPQITLSVGVVYHVVNVGVSYFENVGISAIIKSMRHEIDRVAGNAGGFETVPDTLDGKPSGVLLTAKTFFGRRGDNLTIGNNRGGTVEALYDPFLTILKTGIAFGEANGVVETTVT